MNFPKYMAFFAPIGYGRLARYCGKMKRRHFGGGTVNWHKGRSQHYPSSQNLVWNSDPGLSYSSCSNKVLNRLNSSQTILPKRQVTSYALCQDVDWLKLAIDHVVAQKFVVRGGPLEKWWGGGGDFQFAGILFFTQCLCFFSHLTLHDFFLYSPPCHFSNGPSLTCLFCDNTRNMFFRGPDQIFGMLFALFMFWFCKSIEKNSSLEQ